MFKIKSNADRSEIKPKSLWYWLYTKVMLSRKSTAILFFLKSPFIKYDNAPWPLMYVSHFNCLQMFTIKSDFNPFTVSSLWEIIFVLILKYWHVASIISLFIIEIFVQINDSKQLNNVSTEKSKSIENSLENSIEKNDSIEKSKLTEDEKEFDKITHAAHNNDELEENDNNHEIMEKGKNKLGENVSDGELQNFKNDYLEDNYLESQIDDVELEDNNEMIDENNEGGELDIL